MKPQRWDDGPVMPRAYHCVCGSVVPLLDTSNCPGCHQRICEECERNGCPVCGTRQFPPPPAEGRPGG